MILVDSSVWIELFRRNGELLTSLAVENLLEEGEAILCGLIRLEVLGGAREQERIAISNLLGLVPYLPQNESHWDETVAFQWLCRKEGITIPWSDALIATHARRKGFPVFAKDRHFEVLAEAGLISLYRPGPGGAYGS